MKILTMKILTCCLLLIPWFAISAQDFSSEAGYVDFGNLAGVYGEPRVQVNLGGAMLGFIGAATQNDEPEISELIKNLKQIRVLVYDIGKDAEEAFKTVDKVTSDIQKDGWETIVSVNEEDEKVRIYTKMSGDKIDGLVVMAVEGNDRGRHSKPEAVFINIIGSLDPEQVGRVMNELDIDVDVSP